MPTSRDAVDKADVLGAIRQLPRDSAGDLEMWRRTLERGHEEGRNEIGIAEDLEQEIKLLRFKLDRIDDKVQVKLVNGEVNAGEAADLIDRGQRACEEQIANVEAEISLIVRALMYPGVDRLPADSLSLGDHFAVAWQLFEEWGTTTFADKGFLEEPEILVKALDRIGIIGLAFIVHIARKGPAASKNDMAAVTTLFAQITAEEARATSCAGNYNRIRGRRGACGQLVTIIDQVGNEEYLPPYVAPPRSHFARSRFGARARSSRSKPTRRRGSRRVTSRSSGASGDPDPPPLGRCRPTRTLAAGVV